MDYSNYIVNGIQEVREEFLNYYQTKSYVGDKTGTRVIEIIGASFNVDDVTIFGDVNTDYAEREIKWYESQSLNVNDIPGNTPAIWKQVATPDGFINSNYGWMIYSVTNGSQYLNCLRELQNNPDSRRAVMIYNRPSMWVDYNRGGMSDFVCTFAHQYFVRNGALQAVVNMRSNDAWAGFRNDCHWAKHVQNKLAAELGIPVGNMIWNAGSLHLYEKDWYLVHHYMNTGDHHISKADFNELYGTACVI